MNILNIRNGTAIELFENSILRISSCEKIVNQNFIALLSELEREFDNSLSTEWTSQEVSDFLRNLRKQIK